MQFDVAGAIKAGATPDQIAQFLAEKQGFDLDGALGAGASVDQVIGFLAKPAKEPESRHIGAVLNDTVISIANAAAGGVAAAGDAISPGNRFSKFIDENIVKAGEASQSDAVKAGREKFQREVAASDGLGDEAAAVGRYLADSPLQAAGQAFGSFAGPGLAIKGARGVAGLLGLGARGTVAAGTAAGVATGAAMGGGDAGGEAYDLVMATPDDVLLQNDAVRAEVAKGRPLAEVKEEAAVSAARKASVLPAIAGGVSGAFGVERFLSGGKGFSGGLISRAVKSGLSEAVPEGLEEGLAAYTGQAAASAYDPSIDPMKGVGASATLGAALGLGPGMAAGVLDGVQSRRRAVAEQALQQATDAASAAAAANEMASVDLNAAVNEVEQAVSAYLRPDGGIPTPDQAMAQPTIETPQPLTPQEKQELARQQLQSTPVADPLAELRLQVNPATTMADVAQRRDAVETSAIERMLAADMARPAAQELAPAVATPAPDLAQASAQETTENQLVGLEQKTRERMVNQLMEAAAEPSGYFASRMIPAIDQQLAVLKQPPLTPQERERVVGLTGAAQAFTQPTLPEAPAPAIPDRGADNTSLEARIPEKIPRPSRILGQPTSSYTDDQLTRMIELPDIPAVSRRGASIELSARQAAQPQAAQQAATLTNEGTMPQAAPVLDQPQAQPARVLEQPQPQPAPVLEQPAMPAIQPQDFEQNPPLAQQTPAVAATENVAPTAPVQLGRDQTPLAEGGDLPASQPQDTTGVLFSRSRGPQTLDDVKKSWEDAGIDGSVFESRGRINLSKIVVPKGSRESGTGTTAMQTLVEYADRTGQRIDLTPSSDFGGNKARLVSFYKRFGFVENKGRNKDYEVSEAMYRQPAGAKFSTPRGSKLATPSDGRIVNTDATTTGKAPVPGSKHTLQDGDTTHSFTVVDASKLGTQGRLIQQIARIFGKRVVAFQSDTLQADGFVLNDDQTSIYLNVESTISPMAVFGHELTHQMKKDNPQAYAALEAVVQRNVDEEGMAKFRQEYGEEADIEELSSDLVGDRFREPAFWEDVFNEVAAQNPTGAAAIVQRVGQAIRKAVDTLLKTIRQQGFNADAYVTNLEEIRDAVRVAMVDYAKQQREPAMAGVKDAPVVDGKAKFSNNRSAYDDIRRRLSDGRGIDDDSLLEFLAGQDRRKNARWGYVADRGGLPGVATIYWRGEVAGESGYYTAARFGRNGIGERAFMMGLFPASELTDGSLRDVSRAFADRGYVWYLSAVQTKDGSWEVGTDGAELGSKYRDALLARGEIAPAAGRYTRFTPKESGLPNDLLREGVRRLSLLLNGRTPDVAFTRETGARPRDAITTIKGDRLESRFSRRRRNIFGQQVLPTWTAPTETKLDDFLYVMQDKMVDTKRVVEAVKGAIGRIDDQWNPYLQEELYHGRTATKTKQFLGDELRPLLQDMQSRGVGMADFEEYLHNRHAEERNQQIAKVNPGMQDGGSGIDTADARAYLAGLDPAKRRAYEALARRIDAITAGTRQLLVDNGLETQDTIDAWDAAYSQYVPLNREDLDFSSSFTSTGTGQGFSVKGAASKRATGSKRKVVDILANIAMQRERAIVRAEKNRVATAVYGLAASQPNTDFWLAVNPDAIKDPIGLRNELVKMGLNPLDAQNLIEEPTQTYIDPRTGLVSQRINPALRSSPNVLAVRVDGKDRYVFFNASDERSQRMVTALKNLDADQLGRVMGMAAQVTRWFASVNTQYNPIFGAINFMRDVQGATLQLSTTPIADKKAQVLGDVIPALRGIYADVRAERKGNARPTGAWATLWTEFQKEGAQTGYRDQYSKSAERAQALESELKRITEGKAKQFGRAMFDWLSDYNETMENAVRLAAYKAAKDKGLSNQQAASVAKNLTVNFNRKGQIATQAGALYAFFNAAIQGSTRLVQTLTGPAGKTIIGGGLLLGVIQALMLSAAGYDDDEPPEFARERGFIIPLPDGKYFTIPMPLGYNVIPNTSRVMTEFVLSGYRDPAKRVAQITGALLETFNPIGNAGWSVQTIAPTFADPLVALSENRDRTGKMIAKKDRSDTNPTPGYTRAKETASWFSKELSYYLNLASGGTKYKPGFLSPTPDQIDYLIGQVTGGVGREALKIEQTITSTVTGEELPPYKIPLAGRFYGDTKSASAESNRFYENITRLNEHENELKGRRENRENPGEYLRENPEARLYQFANKIEQDVSKLRKRRRELLERGASKESIKMIETQITNRMKRLNDRVKAVQDAED